MTDDLITLASAYLDGAATAAERAQVEADAALLREVERLRRVRAVLGDIDSAPLSVRERHLAAALDTWDRLPIGEQIGDPTPAGDDAAGAAGGASITAPTPLRDRRPPRKQFSTRILTAAAAVLVLGGAGLVVSGALDPGNDDEASTADFSADAPAELDDAAAAADLEVTPLDAAEETFDAESADGEVADDAVIGAVPELGADPISGGPEAPPAIDDLELLSGNDELAQFANAKVISRTATGSQPAAPNEADAAVADEPAEQPADVDEAPDTTLAPPVDLCGLVDEFVGFALWDSPALRDEPISVGIDNRTGDAVAYQDATCTEITRTPLP